MLDHDNNYFLENGELPYPGFFIEWDKAVRTGKSPGYYEPEELTKIIEIYLAKNEHKKAGQAIEHALKLYVNDEDLLYDIFQLLSDYEQWTDLLALCERYKKTSDVWGDGHKLTALLHLGMEENAFHFFATLKDKYAEDDEALSIIYQSMGEALFEIDLFESTIEVVNEAIKIMGEDIDFYWLLLQPYASLGEKDEVLKIAEKIQNMDPLNAETWYRLGVSFEGISDWEKAIDCFEYALSLDPSAEKCIQNLMCAYEENGNYGKALEKMKDYLRLHPDDFAAYIFASKMSSQVDDWEETLEFINEAIKIAPEVDTLYLFKSSYFLHMQEYRKAKSVLEEAIRLTGDPDGDLIKELNRINGEYSDF